MARLGINFLSMYIKLKFEKMQIRQVQKIIGKNVNPFYEKIVIVDVPCRV